MGKRGPRSGQGYQTKEDKSGKTKPEHLVFGGFWRKHKVSEIMTMDQQDIDNLIDTYLEEYKARKQKKDAEWHFPNISLKNLNDVVNKRMKNVDKSPRIM